MPRVCSVAAQNKLPQDTAQVGIISSERFLYISTGSSNEGIVRKKNPNRNTVCPSPAIHMRGKVKCIVLTDAVNGAWWRWLLCISPKGSYCLQELNLNSYQSLKDGMGITNVSTAPG